MLTDEHHPNGHGHAGFFIDVGFVKIVEHAVERGDLAVLVANDREIKSGSIW